MTAAVYIALMVALGGVLLLLEHGGPAIALALALRLLRYRRRALARQEERRQAGEQELGEFVV